MANRIALPSFSQQEVTSADMRQLVSALELRFNQLEIDDSNLFDTDPLDGAVTGEYAPLDHTHTEVDITDLGDYLTDISGESIFDLSDVDGSPSNNQILVWNSGSGTFLPQNQGTASLDLDDLGDVTAPTPNDADVLTYDSGSGDWIASAPAAATATLAGLTDTDLTSQTQYDLLYNQDGTNWVDTDGELKWNATLGALQLANTKSINWVDGSSVSQELLVLDDSLTTGAEITYAEVAVFAEDTSIGTTFADVTGMTIPMTSLVSGDEYLVVASVNMGTSDTGGTHLGFQIVDHNDVVLDNLPALNESEGYTSTSGLLVQHASVFTAGATGSLDMQMYINSGTGGANHMKMFVMSLTELGASNWAYDTVSGLSIATGSVFVDTGADVTVGNGVDDWLFISTIRTQSGGGSYTGKMQLDIGGATSDRLSATFRGDPGESRTHTGQWVEQAVPASTLVKVQADCDAFGMVEGANIIAINLSAFAQYELAITASPPVPSADVEIDQETLSFTTATPTSDWAFIGACTAFPFTSGTSGNFGLHEIQVAVDGGGEQRTSWDNGYGQSSRATVGTGDDINGQTKMIWPDVLPSIANGASVVADLRYDPNSVTAYDNAGLTQTWLLALPMRLAESGANQFIVGDPAISTVIDGSDTTVNSDLDVQGDITLTGTVDGIDVFTDVTANNAKVTNATHTGEVTGANALTVDPTAITNKTDVTADSADDVLISDDDDSGLLRKVNLSSITDGGFF